MFDEHSERSTFFYLPAFMLVGIAVAWLSGRWDPIFVNDSPSYLDYPFSPWGAMARSIRTPGYPIWLKAFESTVGTNWVPVAQVLLHAFACWIFFREIQRWGMETPAALFVAVTVGVGCTAMDHIATIASDCPAASVGVVAVACLMRRARKGDSWSTNLSLIASVVLAIFLRPAYLFLVPWILVAGAMLERFNAGSFWISIRNTIGVATVIVGVIMLWMGFRFMAVGDFGFLPFGHQNLSGILVQLLSEEELQSLPGELGKEIVVFEKKYDEEVGFEAGAPGATMTIDSRWDEMTYFVVMPAAKEVAGADTIAYHAALAKMNREIVKRYPVRYGKWLAKSARRGAWAIAADIVMHPVFLVTGVVMVLLILHRAYWSGFSIDECCDCVALRAFTLVAFTYMIAKVGFVILTSPPIGRFSDAAAIFIPGWILAVFLHWWRAPVGDTSRG